MFLDKYDSNNGVWLLFGTVDGSNMRMVVLWKMTMMELDVSWWVCMDGFWGCSIGTNLDNLYSYVNLKNEPFGRLGFKGFVN